LTPQTMEFPNINITGFDTLIFSGLFGAGNGPAATDYDAADFVRVQYRIDGADPDAYTNGVCFAYQDNGDDFNEPFGLDADCDGVADVPLVEMLPAMASYGFNIVGTGTTLDLLISVSVNSGDEEFAFDSLVITGQSTGVDSPPQVTTTSPADAAIDVLVESNVLINFNEPVDIAMDAVEISCSSSGIQTFPAALTAGVTSIDIDPVDFTASETCEVTVDAASVIDNDGTADPLDADYVFNFTIEPDLPPEVISTTPADGSVGLGNSDDITIEFSEAVDASPMAVTLVCTQSGTVSFTGLPVDDNAMITINPDSDLIDSETCDLTVLASEVVDIDLTADNLAADVLISFTVGFPLVEIFEIQGAGLVSPFDGLTVATNDNIVTALDVNGFYMQTPDANDDADPLTSSGIFVFTGGAPTVAVGDQVDLTGDIIEFFGLTEFTNPGSYILNIDSSGNPLPTVIMMDDTFPSPDPTVFPCGSEVLGFECFEGMHFDMPQGFISAASVGFFGSDRNDVMVNAGTARAMREPGIDFPGLPGLPVFDGNPELIEMSVDALTLPSQPLAAGSEIALKGVISFGFGDYELQPSELTMINENVIPGAVRDANVDEVTLASANLFRLFNDVDDPGSADDDQIADTAEYNIRLLKLAKYFIEDMKSPMIIALQEIENISVLQDLSAAIANAGGPTYIATLVPGNDVGGINVAYMYQSGMLSNIMVTQLGAAELNLFDGSLLHDRPPLRLEADVALSADTLSLNVLVVHMRSRSSIDSVSDGDRVRNKRLNQANSVAVMVGEILIEDPDKSLYVLGDYNAFEFTDGYVDVIGQITGEAVEADNLLWTEPLFASSPLTQSVQTLVPEDQYSFVFRGSAQVLDNAIMNDEGLMNLIEMQYARGQVDASLQFEDDDTTSLRSTDHDGFVLYIFEDNDLIFKNGFE
ncbi:Alkaline phosphatase, partial [hydrothermal vent metagenome]